MTALLIIGICFTFVGCFFFGFISGLAAGGYMKGYREGREAEHKRIIADYDKEVERFWKIKIPKDEELTETIKRFKKEGIL